MKWGFPSSSVGKESACSAGDLGSITGSGRCPGERRKRWPSPVLLPGEFHGQRSLAGYSPRGHRESDMTVWLNSTFQWSESAACIHISPPLWTSLPWLPVSPTPLGHHRARSWAPCAIIAASHQLSVFKWQCTHVSLNLPIHLHPLHTHMSISCPAVEYNFISRRQCISWRWIYIF